MIPRMRTIKDTFAYIKQNDENTAITETAIRTMVIRGQLPSVRVGKKYLISLETVDRMFLGE